MRNSSDSWKSFLFEFLTYWCGGTTGDEVARHLNMCRETVQRDVIGPYKQQFPGVLRYDRRTRKTRWNDGAAPKFCPADPVAIATVAHSEAIIAGSSGEVAPFDIPVEDVGLVSDLVSEPDVDAFRELFTALARRSAVQLDYLAKSGRRSFSFSPHTLVRTSFRLHFRGYRDAGDGRPGDYIDVIPDRILRTETLSCRDYVNAAADADWHRKVRVVASLLRDLPSTVHAALQREYGLASRDQWVTRPVRAAVAPYIADAFETRRVHGWNGPVWRTQIEIDTRIP